MEKGSWQPLGRLRLRLLRWLMPEVFARLDLAERTMERLDGFPAADTLARMELLEREVLVPEERSVEPVEPGNPWVN